MRYIDNFGRLVSDELYHHGILGMRWGVRHDRYPLKASEHTASEKKAGWKKSLDGGSKVPVSDDKRVSKGKKFKKAVKTGGKIAVACLAVYGTYKIGTSQQARELSQKLLRNKANSANKLEQILRSAPVGKSSFGIVEKEKSARPDYLNVSSKKVDMSKLISKSSSKIKPVVSKVQKPANKKVEMPRSVVEKISTQKPTFNSAGTKRTTEKRSAVNRSKTNSNNEFKTKYSDREFRQLFGQNQDILDELYRRTLNW